MREGAAGAAVRGRASIRPREKDLAAPPESLARPMQKWSMCLPI